MALTFRTAASVDAFGADVSYVTPSFAIGDASSDRWVIAIVSATLFNAADFTIEIGGVAATQVGTSHPLGASRRCYIANVTTGTTATLSFVSTNSATDAYYDCEYAVWTEDSGQPRFVDETFLQAPTSNVWTSDINVQHGGFVVATSRSAFSSASATWTGLTEDADTGRNFWGAASASAMDAETERAISVTASAFSGDFEAGLYAVAFDLSANLNIADGSFDQFFSVAGQLDGFSGLALADGGTKLYAVRRTGASLYEYDLSTAWDIGSLTFIRGIGFAPDSEPQDVSLRPDGGRIFVTGAQQNAIHQATLSTPWNLSTFTGATSLTVTSQDGTPVAHAFSQDGTRLFLLGRDNSAVFAYTLSTAWDVTTGAYDSVSFSVASQVTVEEGLAFSPNGYQMFVVCSGTDTVYQYNLTAPWDISTASYSTNSLDVSGQDTTPSEIIFRPDRTQFYVSGEQNNRVYEYSFGGGGGTEVTGSGTGTASAQTSSGAGERTVLGSGGGAATAQTAAGVGERTVVGSGSATASAQTGSGIGLRLISGSGAGAATSQTASGLGLRLVSGSGAGTVSAQTAEGSASPLVTGTGAGVASSQVSDGVGERSSVGTGAGIVSAQTAIGTGAAEGVTTGAGVGVASGQTATGAGLRVITGTGAATSAAQIGNGAGLRVVGGTGDGVVAAQTAFGTQAALSRRRSASPAQSINGGAIAGSTRGGTLSNSINGGIVSAAIRTGS